MQFHILCIGKIDKKSPEQQIIERYLERLPWPVTIKEFECKKNLKDQALKDAESILLHDAIPKDSIVIALDERGKTPTSQQLSDQLASWQQTGKQHICFLIGGALGHASSTLKTADYILSLGALTWPHKLARAMLLEQIYRLHTIQAGHPYHK